MTREEAIRHLETYSTTNGSGQTSQTQHEEAKRMAIKALEQKPTIKRYYKEIQMGKKRDLANHNIAILINTLVGYIEGYVGSDCPYEYSILGTRNFPKPKDCYAVGCESCKKQFYIALTSELLVRYIVG